MLKPAGIEVPEEVEPAEPEAAATTSDRRVTPQSVISRQLANPFLAPDFSAADASRVEARRLANWELLEPALQVLRVRRRRGRRLHGAARAPGAGARRAD